MDDEPVNLALHMNEGDSHPLAIGRLSAIACSGSAQPEGESAQTVLRCAWNPHGQKPTHECDGRVRTSWRNTDRIPRLSWSCSSCDRQGVVYGWANSLYDQRRGPRSPDCPTHVVPLAAMDTIEYSAGTVFYRAVLEPGAGGLARTWANDEDIDDTVRLLAEFLDYYAERPDAAIGAYRVLSELAGRADPAAEAVRIMDQIEVTPSYGADRALFAELELHSFAHPHVTRQAIGARIAALPRPHCETHAGYLKRARKRLGMELRLVHPTR